MSKLTIALFYVVLASQALNVFITWISVGIFLPQQTSQEMAVTLVLCVIATVVQIVTFYKVAAKSTREARWPVAITMMIVTFVAIMYFTEIGVAYTVSIVDLVVAIIFAASTCGTLIWLKLAPASK